MRLDQFLQQTCGISRKEAQSRIRKKHISVNGSNIRDAGYKLDLTLDRVFYQAKELCLHKEKYFALHKPKGYVCSHQHDGGIPVFSLLNEEIQQKIHCAGRLDVDTTGLVLLTTSGEWLHRVIHPSKKQYKGYEVQLREPINEVQRTSLEEGVILMNDANPTLPAKVTVLSPDKIRLEIMEGRYHQVKRMLASVGNEVIGLHRIHIGKIQLDTLKEGEYRVLTQEEVESF